MLQQLIINNYALISSLTLDFERGLTVITGETGAGKSIIIDALSLILGYRSSKDSIRYGEKKLKVQGIFIIENQYQDLYKVTRKYGIDCEEDMLIISREIDSNGRNSCRCNGTVITVSQLKDIGQYLVDIHGQHEHQSLFNKVNHLKYLDRFDKENMYPILEQNYYIVKKLRKIIDEINEFKKIDEENQSQKTQMEFEINEIEKAGLITGEDEDLENQRRILNNAESIYMNTNMGYAILRGNDETENIALIDQLSSLKECIENLSEIDDNYNTALQSIISASSELEDLAYTLRDYSDQIDFDMGQLNQIEGRLNLITNLKRKYGSTIEEILSYYHELKVSLEKIENKSEHLGKLLEEYKNEYDRYTEQCKIITGKRFENKEIFEKKIENEFADLGMVNGKISVDIKQEERISSSGQDSVEFLISLNPGVPPKPLINIASGGEISRIMLALKTILSEADAIPTMVFDEIDTGISGKMAQIVGEKIYGLSRQHQLICITHLPQIASFADQHIEVNKEIKDNLTETSFIKLDNQLKIEAIARMLGGVEITDTTIKHAEEMIVHAAEIKQ